MGGPKKVKREPTYKHLWCGGVLSRMERVVRLRWCKKCRVEICVGGWKRCVE